MATNNQLSVDTLIAERQKGWEAFTTATLTVVIFMILLLVGMAVFLV